MHELCWRNFPFGCHINQALESIQYDLFSQPRIMECSKIKTTSSTNGQVFCVTFLIHQHYLSNLCLNFPLIKAVNNDIILKISIQKFNFPLSDSNAHT